VPCPTTPADVATTAPYPLLSLTRIKKDSRSSRN